MKHKFQFYIDKQLLEKLQAIKKKHRYTITQIILIAIEYLLTGKQTEDTKVIQGK